MLHVSYTSFRFYLTHANLNNEHIESMRSSDIPDVVSVMTMKAEEEELAPAAVGQGAGGGGGL